MPARIRTFSQAGGQDIVKDASPVEPGTLVFLTETKFVIE